MWNFISYFYNCIYPDKLQRIYPVDEFYFKCSKIMGDLMPIWYVENPAVTNSDFIRVRESWKLITKNKIMIRYQTQTIKEPVQNKNNLYTCDDNDELRGAEKNVIKFNQELEKYESVICSQTHIRKSFDSYL